MSIGDYDLLELAKRVEIEALFWYMLLANKPNGSPNWSFAGKVFYRGLYNRRLAERSELCLRDLK